MSIPQTEAELWQRARSLAGMRLQQLADVEGCIVPETLLRHKGWIGQLLERALGADAASESVPDFTQLGIELKTIPIRADGTPLESTFVTVVPLLNAPDISWETSVIYAKLRRVLWIPLLAEKHLAIGERRIGNPVLWSPDEDEAAVLQRDWEELMDMVCLGQLEKISARLGVALQIRPKAANAKALCLGLTESGATAQTLPRGFYLRPSFTKALLLKNFQNALQ